MSVSYVVQYTCQKLNKTKKWHDGVLVLDKVGDRRGVLRDSNGKSIDSVMISKNFVFEEDAELESDRFLIRIEETQTQTTPPSTVQVKTEPVVVRRTVAVKPSTGFRVPFKTPGPSKPFEPPPSKTTPEPPSVSSYSSSSKIKVTRVSSSPSFEGEMEPAKKRQKRQFRSEKDILLAMSQDQEKLGLFWLHELVAKLGYGIDNPVVDRPLPAPKPFCPPAVIHTELETHSQTSHSFASPVLKQGVRQVRYPETKRVEHTSVTASSEPDAPGDVPTFGGRKRAFKVRTGPSSSSSPIPVDCFKDVRLPVNIVEARTIQSEPGPSIPDCFDSAGDYQRILSTAIVHQLRLQLAEITERICEQLAKGTAGSGGQKKLGKCKKHNLDYGRPMVVRNSGPNHGRLYALCPEKCFTWLEDETSSGEPKELKQGALEGASLEQLNVSHEQGLLRNADVSFMGACELSTTNSFMRERWKSKGRGFDSPYSSSGSNLVYLTLTRKEPSSSYAKDDVWIVFLNGQPNKQALFRSTFHGPNKSLEVEMVPLTRVPFSYGPQPLGICAVRGPNFSSEFKELELLAKLSVDTFPLLPFILQPKEGVMPSDGTVLSRDEQHIQDEPVEQMIASEQLNDDQARVLRDIVRVGIDLNPDPPVTLVHGVFGSGKSTVLSSSLRVLDFLIESLLETDPAANSQILFAATTNAAVDRVLTDLFKRGFTSFLRVGSRRRIAKELFPFTLHCLASDEDDVAEMKDMLRKTQTPEEVRYIKQEIEAVTKGQMNKRRELLNTVRVVGATCTACTFDVLAQRHFRLVVMDECSQTTEPTSLLAMANFFCERIVLVGDPQQLPPVITSGSHGGGDHVSEPQGLEKTMFERLSRSGVKPIMLRTQYRCHPTISGIASKLFYSGQLRDGITAADRLPVVPGLPPVVLCRGDAGCEQTDNSGSVFNDHEAKAASTLVSMLVHDYDVAPEKIGVICLYRAQAFLIRRLMDSDSTLGTVPVSTVDSFQGEERDVIILTVARTVQLGFSDSPKRLNVAITRAKRNLIIIGHYGLLSKNEAWRTLLQPALDASATGGVQDCKTIISTRSLSIPE